VIDSLQDMPEVFLNVPYEDKAEIISEYAEGIRQEMCVI
jgi:hypothetical protein